MQGPSAEIIADTKKRISGMGKYYTDSYVKNKERRMPYCDPVSNRQIATIVKFANPSEYAALFTLISKFVRMGSDRQNYQRTVFNLLSRPDSDKRIYLAIGSKIPKTTEYQPNEQYSFVSLYYPTILSEAGYDSNAEYLDIGCGTGAKAKKLGTDIGLDLSKIYGVDVKQWSVLTEELRKSLDINFEFIDTSGKLPYPDGKFGLVTIFMVLHHVTELKVLISEIHRILKPGGFLMIREHDCRDKIDYMMVDIEHMLYDYIKIPGYDPAKYELESKMRYLSADEWTTVFENSGFKLKKWDFDYNLKQTISATRTYYAIYVK